MINLQEITVILNAQNLCVTFLKQEMREKRSFISYFYHYHSTFLLEKIDTPIFWVCFKIGGDEKL